MKKNAVKIGWLMVLPGCLFVVFFMLVPLFLLIFRTFFDEGGFTLSGYFEMFSSTYFKQVFLRSVKLSLISTAICAILGFPTSYYIAKYSKNKGVLMAPGGIPHVHQPGYPFLQLDRAFGKKRNCQFLSGIHRPV